MSDPRGHIENVRTFCRVCEPACGLVATVRDGELERLVPDRDHPVSRGYACHKGLFGVDIHRDPDRLDHPQRRRADGGFERIDWATATAEIAARLQTLHATHGADAIAGYLGNPGEYNALLPEAWYGFFRQLGTSRLFNVNTQDCGNKFAGSAAVFGSVTIQPIPDFARTELLLLLGENPQVSQMSFVSLPHAMDTLKAIEDRGGRVICVNPRRIETLDRVGEWLPIAPDTDVWFLAALLHELERLGHFDADVLARHGRGVSALRAFVREYPPTRVAAVTGIAAATITALADAFGRARGASIHMSTGVNMGRHGTLAYWLLHMMAFVTGNLDRPGGNVLSVGYYTRRARAGRLAPDALAAVDTPHGRMPQPRPPVFPVPGNLLPDLLTDAANPIRALIVCAGNPVLSMGGEARLREALPALELLVVIDLYRNATAEYAHYVLPATDAFEREDINALGTGMQAYPNIQYTRAVVSPRAERRHERAIIGDIAAAMGLAAPDALNDADPWSKTDHMLRSRGLGFAALKAAEVLTFGEHETGRFYTDFIQTPDQRVDCFPAHFAPALAALATDFASRIDEPAGRLRLISRRDARMMNSWYANVPQLRSKTNRFNPLYMHPADAAARGLTDGATARVWNAHGEIAATVRLDETLLPGAVAMSHGWGHAGTPGMRVAQAAPGVNCNRLLPTGPGSFDALSGQAHMTGVVVEVEALRREG